MSESQEAVGFCNEYNQLKDQEILKPFQHLNVLDLMEYKYMLKVFRAFNIWLNVQQDKLEEILSIIDMIVANFLIVDDMLDNSVCRNGILCAHVKFGLPATINVTNFETFIILKKLLDLQGLEAVTMYTDFGIATYRGQGTEIYWRENLQCPSEEEYVEMIMCKIGSGFLMTIKLMQLFSNNKTDFTKLTKMLMAFTQIHNDYINLKSTKYMKTKSYCEDITEGKFTFPIIHAIKSRPDDTRVMDILKMKTEDNEVKQQCVALLEEFGSMLYTKQTLLKLKKEILEEAERIGKNPLLMEILEDYYNELISDNI